MAGTSKRRKFKTFTFRGIKEEDLVNLSNEEIAKLVKSKARRRMKRGLKGKPYRLILKLRKAKKNTPFGEKPEVVKTHLRDMLIFPEMIGSMVGVYNGIIFNTVEIKADMVGHTLGEFSLTYKPIKHGRPGIGATSSSKFVPIK